MADSMSLVTAQVSFLDTRLAIVHIPIKFYSLLLQPILRLLFEEHREDHHPWSEGHDFLNISITPLECSIVCSRELLDTVVAPIAEKFNCLAQQGDLFNRRVEINQDDYIAIQVEGEGLDAGQRVLELTAPLAMARISVFFITTYFCDYVLVPYSAKHTVMTALQQRGFVFSEEADAFVSQLSPVPTHTQSSEWLTVDIPNGSDSRPSLEIAPSTPPAKDIPELQIRTFSKLRSHEINPVIDPNLRLVSCAGSRDNDEGQLDHLKNELLQVLITGGGINNLKTQPGTDDTINTGLGIISATDALEPAKFLSITLTAEPVSVLLEERILSRFGSCLLGNRLEEDILTPIILDLSELGWSARGIIAGVAGRLSQSLAATETESEVRQASDVVDNSSIEISFLSTAKSGIVVVKASELESAVRSLETGMQAEFDS